jgi:ferredoxin-type protein NapH
MLRLRRLPCRLPSSGHPPHAQNPGAAGCRIVGLTLSGSCSSKRTMSKNRQNIRKSILASAFLLFEYRLFHLFFSPVLIVVAASQGLINGSMIMYGLLFLSSLYFGRAWCGWLCPGAAINEVCSLVVEKRPRENKAYAIKFVSSGLLMGAVILLAIRAGGFHSIVPFFGLTQESTSQDIFLLFGAVVIIVPVAFLLGKQAHCHYLCWQAPILIIGTKIKEHFRWPSLHLEVSPDACLDCGACDRNCPMSLQVAAMVKSGSLRHAECILCGNCVDHCSKGAIQYSFGAPKS